MAEEIAYTFEDACRIAKKIARASGKPSCIKRCENCWLVVGDISFAQSISPEVYGMALDDCYSENQLDTAELVKELEARTKRRKN